MFRKRPEQERPRPPASARPAAPEQPAQPASAGQRPTGRPPGTRPSEAAPDLTRWVGLLGAAGFVVLFLAAAALYVFGQISAEPVILPTPLDPVAVATEAALPTATAEPPPTAVAEAPTPEPTPQPLQYVVQPNDTLVSIAAAHGLTLAQVLEANPQIANPDLLVAGQTLTIPVLPTPLPPTAPSPGAATSGTPGAEGPPRSVFEGDLEAAYPLTRSGPRVTLHYQPGSFTDLTGAEIILENAEETLGFVEQRLGVSYDDPFDLYVAGWFFADNLHLRGRAFSTQNRAFVLYDGSGSPAERRYMLAHEMTHVVSWHTYGKPTTVMLSEGLATYGGLPYLDQGGFIPARDFCRALVQVNRMPSLAALQNSVEDFRGHIVNLFNYNTAACFVAYLFEQGGAEAFAALYPTSNYTGNFGAGLGQLEAQYRQSLSAEGAPLAFDPNVLVSYYDEVQAAYIRLLANPAPDMEAYLLLDSARLAVLGGDFPTARARLDEYRARAP